METVAVTPLQRMQKQGARSKMANDTKLENMSAAILRLRASKVAAEEEDGARGARAGKLWAAEAAEYAWLRRLVLSDRDFIEHPFEALRAAIDANGEIDSREVQEICFGEEKDISDEYIVAFIMGATEVFSQVRSEL